MNLERVGKALEPLRAGLSPFGEWDFQNVYGEGAEAEARQLIGEDRAFAHRPLCELDIAALLKLICGSLIRSTASTALKPWREVVTSHPDVASGRYQLAEFAADIWQVFLGEVEYRHPVGFFRRTYVTESLQIPDTRKTAETGQDKLAAQEANPNGSKPLEPPRRFYGTVSLNAARVRADAGRVAEEVHLAGIQGAEVQVTLEVEAVVPGDVPDRVERVVTENRCTLRFTNHIFERE